MKHTIIFLLIITLFTSCSSSPTKSKNSLPSQLNAQLHKLTPQLTKCLQSTGLEEIVIYMNITRHGMVENVTLIPWQTIEKRQCISMVIGHLRLNNFSHKEFKVRKVIQL